MSLLFQVSQGNPSLDQVALDLPWEESLERLLLLGNAHFFPLLIYRVGILIFYGCSVRSESIKWVQGLVQFLDF